MTKKFLSNADWFLLATWGVYFFVLFSRMVSLSPEQGLQVGHEYLWSDWASLHTGMTRIFATKTPGDWFAYHPVYADGKFTYPFFVNLLSGLLLRVGFSFETAMMLPYFIAAPALLLGLRRLFTLILNSQWLSVLAISLFFLSAGFGFTKELSILLRTGDWSQAFPISTLPSAVPSHSWGANNFIIAMLLPQRAFMIGLPLAVWAIYGFVSVLRKSSFGSADCRRLVASGLILGLLSIVHAHSLMASAIVLFPLALYGLSQPQTRTKVLWFALPGTLLAVALYLVFVAGGIKTRFMQPLIGFTANSLSDWIWFWTWVWGISLPLAAVGASRIGSKRKSLELYFAISGFLLFALGNLVLFQPTRWDNSKIFLWSFLLLTPAMARALEYLWQKSKPFAFAAALVATLTGCLELTDLQMVARHRFQILSPQEIAFAERVNRETAPLARFATATAHHHFVSTWAARPVLVGYLGWLGNFGMNYQQTHDELREIYRGSPRTVELIAKHRLNYVVVGPHERNEFGDLNEVYFSKNFPVAMEDKYLDIRIYRIR